MNDRILFDDVSKFYGEILGVNRVSLDIPPGITTLVGPNGSGKTTLMNLMTGLIQLSSGRISVLRSFTERRDRVLPQCRLLYSVRFVPPRHLGVAIRPR